MLDLALKEWAVICDLLLEGDQALLLRKGGVHEDAGPGRFRLEHERFALFPAWEHQDPRRIKPEYRDRARVFDAEPSELTIRGFAEVPTGCVWRVPGEGGRAAFDTLDDLHAWTAEQIDMRFDYKPHYALYVLALRAYRLREPKTIPNRPEYYGCRSWVPLAEGDRIDTADAEAVMDASRFDTLCQRIGKALGDS